MEGVLLVPLIKIYMKDLFGPVIELLYRLSSTNKKFLHFVHNGTRFYDKYISPENKKNILMMTGVEFSPNKRLEICTIQNINLLIQIDIML